MKIQEVRTVKRPITYKVMGTKKKDKIELEYKVPTQEEASELIKQFDEISSKYAEKDDDDSRVSLARAYAVFLSELLPDGWLTKWDVEESDSAEIREINFDNVALVLNDGYRFAALRDNFRDLISECDRGKPVSVEEREIKNLLRSARG